MASANTRNFKCWEDDMPPGPPKLIVTGEVQTDGEPTLAEASPQGIVKEILLLNLTAPPAGPGAPWKRVRFEKKISANQYREVDIRSGGQEVAKLKVEHVS
jgi:hypothetical protein